MKNNIVKDTLILTVITLVAGLLLGVVYEITKKPIAEQELLAKQEAYQAVFTDAESFEPIYEEENSELQSALAEKGYTAQTVNEVMQAMDASGNPLGYALNLTTSEGYGGDITFSIGIREDGTVNGISILTIGETAGLGMNADTDAFKGQFANKNVESFTVTKTGSSSENEIDALSGATITSNAMTGGVNAGICAFQYLKGGN